MIYGMARPRDVGLLITATLIALVCVGSSAGPLEGTDVQLPPEAGLRSPDEQNRLEAARRLVEFRRGLFLDLEAIGKQETGRKYNGPRHLAMQQMGLWRLEEAVPFLIGNVHWEIEPGSRDFEKLPAWAMYPGAVALRDIGGRTVRAAVTRAIRETDEDTKLRLLAWVLSSMDGPALARMHLAASLEGVTVQAMRARTEKAIEYAAQGDAVFAGM